MHMHAHMLLGDSDAPAAHDNRPADLLAFCIQQISHPFSEVAFPTVDGKKSFSLLGATLRPIIHCVQVIWRYALLPRMVG